MLCPQCGKEVPEGVYACPDCGMLLRRSGDQEEGLMAMRQGRRSASPDASRNRRLNRQGAGRQAESMPPLDATAPIAAFESGVFEADGTPLQTIRNDRTARSVYGDTMRDTAYTKRQSRGKSPVDKRMVNWMKVLVAGIVLLLGLIAGGYLYLKRSDNGQRILARMGRDASSTALWEVGEEALDTGAVDAAINYFEKAWAQDGDENINVDNLLLLGSAYEAAGRMDDAETLYTKIYQEIVPSAPDAYRNVIRIMQAQNRLAEAAELMATAASMTGLNTFATQRTELLPLPPTVSLIAGYYTEKKSVSVESPEGYEVYYTFDEEAELPGEGTLVEGPLLLDEGVWDLRAVTVNGELVSDPLKASYKIFMPTPQTPRCSLAPGTYRQRQKIRLWPGLDNVPTRDTPEGDKETDITIYYTIDGSNPDADSPIYVDGEPFALPGGKVTLKALAVNGYGKAGNMLEVGYKIEAKPYPLTAFSMEDVIPGIALNSTTREEFIEVHGQPESTEEITVPGFDTGCERHNYPWGHATFNRTNRGLLLVELYFTSQFAGPRNTSVGMTENEVIGKFRDMGQVASASGNRGLYQNDSGKGKLYRQEDGTSIVRYLLELADGASWQLEYHAGRSGVVDSICMTYLPVG